MNKVISSYLTFKSTIVPSAEVSTSTEPLSGFMRMVNFDTRRENTDGDGALQILLYGYIMAMNMVSRCFVSSLVVVTGISNHSIHILYFLGLSQYNHII